jgi:hypothetical protein
LIDGQQKVAHMESLCQNVLMQLHLLAQLSFTKRAQNETENFQKRKVSHDNRAKQARRRLDLTITIEPHQNHNNKRIS